MNRQEVLKWCVENIKDWPYDELPQEFDGDWTWGGLIGSIRLYSLDRCETSITKQDWLEAKKAEPEVPYMPKVGEECESMLIGSRFREGRLLYKSEKLVVWQESGDKNEYANRPEHRIFRPIRTERELFIEQATKDYLDQVGSDAVNEKWFERIFGALYDAGNLSYKN